MLTFDLSPGCSLFFAAEYTITMYDTKSREVRWNATYSDYASTLPDDDTKYSKIPDKYALTVVPNAPTNSLKVCALTINKNTQ